MRNNKVTIAIYAMIVSAAIITSNRFGIVHTPTILPISLLSFTATSYFIMRTAAYEWSSYRKNLKNLENSLTDLLQKTNSQSLENFNEKEATKHIAGLSLRPSQKQSTTNVPKSSKKKKSSYQKESHQNNIILASLALHIIKTNPIKFAGKTINSSPPDIDLFYFNESGNYDLPISTIMERSKLYLNNLRDKFCPNKELQPFLNKLLQENNFFLDQKLNLNNLQTFLEKSLVKLNKNLEKPNSKKKEVNILETDKTTTRITSSNSKLNPNGVIGSSDNNEEHNPTNLDEESLSTTHTSSRPDSKQIIAIANYMLLNCGVDEDFSIEYQNNRLELKPYESNDFPNFVKIFNGRISTISNPRDEGLNYFSIPHKNSDKLTVVFKSISQNYQNTPEYYSRSAKIEATKLEQLNEILNKLSKSKEKYYFEQWKNFTTSEAKLESNNKLDNYEQFSEFLNESNYLRNIAKNNDVYLKGSMLTSNLLKLNKAKARDIDLEIYLPNLFLSFAEEERIKEIAKGRIIELLKTEAAIRTDLINNAKINIKDSYLQFEYKTPNSQIIDLSFYDKSKIATDKPSPNDWVYSSDALRLNLTEALKAEYGEITKDILKSIPLTVSNGFAKKHPNITADQLVKLIKTYCAPFINLESPDLLFNTVKHISKGLLKREEVKSLYENDEDFRSSFKNSLNLMISRLKKLPDKCNKAGITTDYFNDTLLQIGAISNPLITSKPSSNTSIANANQVSTTTRPTLNIVE